MYILEKKPGVTVGYANIVNKKFKTLEELINFCYQEKLFNQDVKREQLQSEIDVDWYLTNLITRKTND